MSTLPFKFDIETIYAIAEYDPPDEYYDEEKGDYILLDYDEGKARQEDILKQFEVLVCGERVNAALEFVFKHKDTNRLFRFDAYYDSWNGGGLSDVCEDDLYEVKVVDRVVRFYEPI